VSIHCGSIERVHGLTVAKHGSPINYIFLVAHTQN
jgi:hypothetical protein